MVKNLGTFSPDKITDISRVIIKAFNGFLDFSKLSKREDCLSFKLTTGNNIACRFNIGGNPEITIIVGEKKESLVNNLRPLINSLVVTGRNFTVKLKSADRQQEIKLEWYIKQSSFF